MDEECTVSPLDGAEEECTVSPLDDMEECTVSPLDGVEDVRNAPQAVAQKENFF